MKVLGIYRTMQVLIRYNYLTFWRLLSVDDLAIESHLHQGSLASTHTESDHMSIHYSYQFTGFMVDEFYQKITIHAQSHTPMCSSESQNHHSCKHFINKDTDTLKIPHWPERLHRCPVRVPITLCWFKTTDRNVHMASFHQVYWSVCTPHSVL